MQNNGMGGSSDKNAERGSLASAEERIKIEEARRE